ncbi:MAG: hypothetical protein M1837_001506 [Sclerophora amabilis]|nr:MAG: hypothetical protein M1837_001506 [Sclerophora amabilis]
MPASPSPPLFDAFYSDPLQLLLISGYPMSGKTRRAKQIEEHFANRISTLTSSQPSPRLSRLKVHYVSDDTLSLSRDVYSTAKAEKDARAAFYSAVKRVLGPDDIVIADSLNYIKGFRYQLYCEAKAMGTPNCVVQIHIGTAPSTCRALNNAAISSPEYTNNYSEEDFENLILRYEEPNGMTRWDSPLFTVLYDDLDPPYDAIWDAMIGSSGDGGKGPKPVKPNQATLLKPVASSSYLYELDRTTQDIITRILAYQKDHLDDIGGGGAVPISSSDGDLIIELPTGQVLALPKLQRVRRQFINQNRQHNQQQGGNLNASRIGAQFVDYLNDQFRTE